MAVLFLQAFPCVIAGSSVEAFFFSKHLFLSSACANANKKKIAAKLRTSAQITGRNVRRSLQSETFAAATYRSHLLTTLHVKHDCSKLCCSTTVPHLSCLCNLLSFLLPLHTSPPLNLYFPYTIYSIGSVSVRARSVLLLHSSVSSNFCVGINVSFHHSLNHSVFLRNFLPVSDFSCSCTILTCEHYLMHFQHFVLLPFDQTPLPAHLLTIFLQDVDNVLSVSLILFFVEVTSSHGYLGPIPGCSSHGYLDSFPGCVRDFPCFKPHFCPSLHFFFFLITFPAPCTLSSTEGVFPPLPSGTSLETFWYPYCLRLFLASNLKLDELMRS